MSNRTNRLAATLIGVALLTIGLGGAVLFVKTKPQAERGRSMSSMVPVVETMPLEISSRPLVVECLGTVIPDKAVAIQPDVTGRIVAVNPRLVEGERVNQGDVLVEIEDADYRLALKNAETDLLTAQSNYRIEEGQQDSVRHELELMGDEPSESYRDLMLREPQLKSAEAAVMRAELAIERAQLDLERTHIKAPFDAVVLAKDADAGDYAQNARTLLELAGTDRFFIRASIPLSALEYLPRLGDSPYPAELTLSDGTTRPARTHKLLPDLTEKGRMARMLLSVADPYAAPDGRPLLLHEVVRVEIEGETVENTSLIPRAYLRDGDVLWMIDDVGSLRVVPVEVLQGYADEILVRIEKDTGMDLVTTDLGAAVDGMPLRRVGEPVSPDPGRKGKPPEGRGKGKQGA